MISCVLGEEQWWLREVVVGGEEGGRRGGRLGGLAYLRLAPIGDAITPKVSLSQNRQPESTVIYFVLISPGGNVPTFHV